MSSIELPRTYVTLLLIGRPAGRFFLLLTRLSYFSGSHAGESLFVKYDRVRFGNRNIEALHSANRQGGGPRSWEAVTMITAIMTDIMSKSTKAFAAAIHNHDIVVVVAAPTVQ